MVEAREGLVDWNLSHQSVPVNLLCRGPRGPCGLKSTIFLRTAHPLKVEAREGLVDWNFKTRICSCYLFVEAREGLVDWNPPYWLTNTFLVVEAREGLVDWNIWPNRHRGKSKVEARGGLVDWNFWKFLKSRLSQCRGPRGPCGLKYNMLYIHMLFLSTTAGYVVYFSWLISW